MLGYFCPFHFVLPLAFLLSVVAQFCCPFVQFRCPFVVQLSFFPLLSSVRQLFLSLSVPDFRSCCPVPLSILVLRWTCRPFCAVPGEPLSNSAVLSFVSFYYTFRIFRTLLSVSSSIVLLFVEPSWVNNQTGCFWDISAPKSWVNHHQNRHWLQSNE